jgi:hypothetical protein
MATAGDNREEAEPASGDALEAITARLDQLATELDGDLDEDRAAELVREASELAARAGQEVDRALQAAAEARGA